jgi:hypothetical protein
LNSPVCKVTVCLAAITQLQQQVKARSDTGFQFLFDFRRFSYACCFDHHNQNSFSQPYIQFCKTMPCLFRE